jgi:hypothetical protein
MKASILRLRAGQVVANSTAEEEAPDIAIRNNGDHTVVYEMGPLANRDIKAPRVSFSGTAFGEIKIAGTQPGLQPWPRRQLRAGRTAEGGRGLQRPPPSQRRQE